MNHAANAAPTHVHHRMATWVAERPELPAVRDAQLAFIHRRYRQPASLRGRGMCPVQFNPNR